MDVGSRKWGLLIEEIEEARPSFGVLFGVEPFGLRKVLHPAEEHGLRFPTARPLNGRGSISSF